MGIKIRWLGMSQISIVIIADFNWNCHATKNLFSCQIFSLYDNLYYLNITIFIQNYGGDVGNSPLPVQVALIHALALADEHKSALEILAKLSDSEK